MHLFILGVLSLVSVPSFAQDKLKELEDRINKLESQATPARTAPGSFNPALGMALDMYQRNGDDKADFRFRSAEFNV
ncbi:MAG: hypothetical protein HY925_02315 [Elusimicrobia bacterium]|nr:hypothetical protein [Elusimicrobiota bacterium]